MAEISIPKIVKLALGSLLALLLVVAIVVAMTYLIANQRLGAEKASLMEQLGINESDLVTLRVAERPLGLQVACLSSINRMLQAGDCGPRVNAFIEGSEPESRRAIVVAVGDTSAKRRAIVHLVADPPESLRRRTHASFACAGKLADAEGVTNFYGCYLGTRMERLLSLSEQERWRACQSYEDYAYQAVTMDCAALDLGSSDACAPADRDMWTLDRAEEAARENPALARRLERLREAGHR